MLLTVLLVLHISLLAVFTGATHVIRWRNTVKPPPPAETPANLLFECLRPYGDQPWWEGINLWEPPVQLALQDLCQLGSVVFDVGANLGGLTAVMSRLVGPKGTVCSFEASPRIFAHLQLNIVKQGFQNVFPIPRAVYFRSFEQIKVFQGDHLNDSIYHSNPDATTYSTVETVALDDFVEVSGLVPDTVKMDIEGAEYDALLGATALVDKHRPHMILEQQTNDQRCLNFFIDRGYCAIDVNTLRSVRSLADYPASVGLRNVLFIHEERLESLPYTLPAERDTHLEIKGADFRTESGGWLAGPFRLPAGRYFADMLFEGQGIDNEMVCGASIDGQQILRYHANTKLLSDSYRDWVFDIQREANLEFFFSFRGGSGDSTFAIRGATLARLRSFRPRPNARLLLK